MWVWENIDKLANVFTIIATLVTACIIITAVLQYRATKKTAREVEALATYREYIGYCVQYPHLSSYSSFRKWKERDFDIDDDTNTNDDEQYMWFLYIFLNACERVIFLLRDDPAWHRALTDQVKYHFGAIEKVWEQDRQHYSIDMQNFVDGVLREISQ